MSIKNFLEITPSASQCHGGEGLVKIASVYEKKELRSPLQFIHYTVLPPKTSIGSHPHTNDEEVYVVLEGSGVMEVDGGRHPVKSGDVVLNKPYGTHALRNDSETAELKILVFCAANKIGK